MASLIQDHSPLVVATFALGGIYILYHLMQSITRFHRRRVIIKQNGCKPFPSYPHRDPMFGLDLFLKNVKLLKTGDFLIDLEARFKNLNTSTYSHLLLGERVINTVEPENAKAILTNVNMFHLPTRRVRASRPVLGHGIFTTDGREWETSRALLRPNFTRSQVGDLETFETHIAKLIAKIPRDGSTVDLQQMFFMLTIDSATEFLFGHSTDVLGAGSESGEMFADAFTYGMTIF